MRFLLIHWAILAVSLAVAAALLDEVEISGGVLGTLGLALLFGFVNALVRPIVQLLALPLRLITLGLATFVINGLLFLATAWLSDVLDVGGLIPAIAATIIISIVSALLSWLVVSLVAGASERRRRGDAVPAG